MDIKKLLGKKIKEIRKNKNFTQEKMAELIGIETASLSNIENGKYYPTAENLAPYLFNKVKQALQPLGLTLKSIELWENENAAAVFEG